MLNFFQIGAQPAETPASPFEPPDGTRCSDDETEKYMGWTKAQLEAARAHGLPVCDSLRQTSNEYGVIDFNGTPTRLKRFIDKWAAEQEQLAAEKLALVRHWRAKK